MIHISKGNSKLGPDIANISLRPVLDCGNCSLCKKKCYALKSYRMYPNVKKNWDENSLMARKDRDNYFLQIADYLNKKDVKYFRWHVAGDIPDQNYLDNMVRIAQMFQETYFLCFTKRFDLNYRVVNLEHVHSLSVMFSIWPKMELPKRVGGVPFAWCQDGKELRMQKRGYHMCPGSCKDCKQCWEDNTDVVFNMH